MNVIEKKPFWLHYNSIKLLDNLCVDEFGWHKTESGYYKEETRSNNIIQFVYSGVCRVTVWEDDMPKEFLLHSGEAFMINQGVRHGYESDIDEPCARYWLSCSGSAYGELLEKIGFSSRYEIISGIKTNNIAKCFQILKTNMQPSIVAVLTMYSCVFEILRHIAKSAVPKDYLPDKDPTNLYLDSIVKYIDNNLQENLKIETIAEQFGYERSYLYRLFKKKFNVSIKKYINEKRILKARTLVIETDKTFKEIAEEVGYKDYSTFLKQFKAICHQSPEKNKEAFKKFGYKG